MVFAVIMCGPRFLMVPVRYMIENSVPVKSDAALGQEHLFFVSVIDL